MTFLKKLEEIEQYLKKIAELNTSVRNRRELNRLQGDLVRDYLRDLYELYGDLEKSRQPSTPVIAPPVTAEPEPQVEEVNPEPTEHSRVAEEQVEVTIDDDSAKTGEPVQKKEEEEKEEEKEEEPIVLSTGKSAITVSDTVENEQISLLEKFQKESQSTELNQKKLAGKTLSELIPLNEKFMFISEFFDNSISRYETTISELDLLTNKTAVLDHMQKNAWSSEIIEQQQDLIDRFIRIIDLKYAD